MSDRIPPQNLESEQAVLGSCMVEREAIDKATQHVQRHDFYRSAHQAIWDAIMLLWDADEPVDVLTLREKLLTMGLLEKSGGVTYLFQLQNAVPSAANVVHYAKIVSDKAVRRRIIDAANRQIEAAFDEEREKAQLIGDCGKMLEDAVQGQDAGEYRTMRQIVAKAFEEIEAASECKGGVTGVDTGFEDLNFCTAGWQKGELTIIGARAGIGKSAITINSFGMAAVKAGKKVIVFSLEMRDTQLIKRLIANNQRVSGTHIRTGQLHDHEWRKVGEESGHLSEMPFHIDARSSLTISQIRARLREVARKDFAPDIAIIDYLALIGGRVKGESEHHRVDQIAESLKQLAKEFDIPVLLLTQLNREIERGPYRAPVLADLKEGGEPHADIVLMMWPAKEEPRTVDGQEVKKIWIKIAKNRNGMMGDIPLIYHTAWTRFDQMVKDVPVQQAVTSTRTTSNGTLPSQALPYKDNDEDSTTTASSTISDPIGTFLRVE